MMTEEKSPRRRLVICVVIIAFVYGLASILLATLLQRPDRQDDDIVTAAPTRGSIEQNQTGRGDAERKQTGVGSDAKTAILQVYTPWPSHRCPTQDTLRLWIDIGATDWTDSHKTGAGRLPVTWSATHNRTATYSVKVTTFYPLSLLSDSCLHRRLAREICREEAQRQPKVFFSNKTALTLTLGLNRKKYDLFPFCTYNLTVIAPIAVPGCVTRATKTFTPKVFSAYVRCESLQQAAPVYIGAFNHSHSQTRFSLFVGSWSFPGVDSFEDLGLVAFFQKFNWLNARCTHEDESREGNGQLCEERKMVESPYVQPKIDLSRRDSYIWELQRPIDAHVRCFEVRLRTVLYKNITMDVSDDARCPTRPLKKCAIFERRQFCVSPQPSAAPKSDDHENATLSATLTSITVLLASSSSEDDWIPSFLYAVTALISLITFACSMKIVWQRQRQAQSYDVQQKGNLFSEFDVPITAILFQEQIGEGLFGVVMKGCLKTTRQHKELEKVQTAAIKSLRANYSEKEKADFLSEIRRMIDIGQHRHLVKMVACCTDSHPPCLMMEFVPHGNLRQLLRQTEAKLNSSSLDGCENHSRTMDCVKGCEGVQLKTSAALGLTESTIIDFAHQIADGMSYLSGLKMVHRDLAARNILVSCHRTLKISDFGMTRDVYMSMDEVYMKTSREIVPWRWMALESMLFREYSTASDVWAYGVVLWEISSFGRLPYSTVTNEALLPYVRQGKRLCQPEHCPDRIYRLMCLCWMPVKTQRPSFSAILAKLKAFGLEEGECV